MNKIYPFTNIFKFISVNQIKTHLIYVDKIIFYEYYKNKDVIDKRIITLYNKNNKIIFTGEKINERYIDGCKTDYELFNNKSNELYYKDEKLFFLKHYTVPNNGDYTETYFNDTCNPIGIWTQFINYKIYKQINLENDNIIRPEFKHPDFPDDNLIIYYDELEQINEKIIKDEFIIFKQKFKNGIVISEYYYNDNSNIAYKFKKYNNKGTLIHEQEDNIGKKYDDDGSIIYEGFFIDNKPHGYGIAYDKQGKAYEGKFNNGNTTQGHKFKLKWLDYEWNKFEIVNL